MTQQELDQLKQQHQQQVSQYAELCSQVEDLKVRKGKVQAAASVTRDTLLVLTQQIQQVQQILEKEADQFSKEIAAKVIETSREPKPNEAV